MKIIVKLKNTKNSPSGKFEFLFGLMNYGLKNLGLPDGVKVDVTIHDDMSGGSGKHKISYKKFLASLIHNPIAASISSDNNRQLDFFVMDVFGTRHPIVPQLTIDGHIRTDDEWDPKKYNIADTGEIIVMDGKEIISISLKPKKEFKLEFKICEAINLSGFGEAKYRGSSQSFMAELAVSSARVQSHLKNMTMPNG